ncbi:hypothetical protein [Paenibacillus glycanilyticus]|uniref:DUF2140 domain-containing protein n=1 Tax=Paenibacillus glycanilyticus TaxID=126569 RepID=A0ABQ6G8Z5_9BACL|nr:hypothetical protein [Paenibacillus glycanilyticus]GLX67424.1 hypothetical protein MU1_17690 [Paenibacillus glycanilyticus]
MFRWLKWSIIVLVLLVAAAAGGGLWLKSYVAPSEKLDLAYDPVSIEDKALQMVANLKPEIVLSEADVNNLIKSQLQGGHSASLPPDMKLDGARFELSGDRLIAHLNMTYRDFLPVGMLATYKMSWKAPNLIIEPVSLTVKDYDLGKERLDRMVVPIQLPSMISIRDMQFQSNQIVIGLKLSIRL